MDNSLKLQMDVRNNAEELRSFMLDMNNWEKDMKKKDLALKNDKNKNTELPPPRNKLKKTSLQNEVHIEKSVNTAKKPKKIDAYDYAAWDKYDAEKACDEIDEETLKDEVEPHFVEDKIDNKDAKKEANKNDSLKSETLKNIDEAFYQKELGNQFVRKQNWEEAINCYTKAIELNPNNAIYYANRALCFIKLKRLKVAEVDATISIQLDKTYIKSYQRRAIARTGLEQYQEAKSDYQEILKLDPNNNNAKLEIVKLDKILEKSNCKAKEAKNVKPTFDPKNIFKSDPNKDSTNKQNKKLAVKCDKVIDKKENVASSESAVNDEKEKNVKRFNESYTTASKTSYENKNEVGENANVKTEILHKEPVKNVNEEKQMADIFGEIPEGFKILKPINIPPHLRSKKPLRRIKIKEVLSDAETFDELINLTNSLPQIDEEEKEKSSNFNEVKIIKTEKHLDLDKISFTVPENSIQFQKSWKIVRDSPRHAHSYLKKIKPSDLPQIFRHSLESDLFSELISCLAKDELLNDAELVYSFLFNLSLVQRFRFLIMFMSTVDSENVIKCISRLKDKFSSDELEELRRLYEL